MNSTVQHKFQIFLEKPSTDERQKNINVVTDMVNRLNGHIHETKLDHNEIFDVMVVSWNDDQIQNPFMVMHPMMLLSKFYCVMSFKRV